MKQQTIVDKQFGSAVSAYLASPVHAKGQDLAIIQEKSRNEGL